MIKIKFYYQKILKMILNVNNNKLYNRNDKFNNINRIIFILKNS